VTHAPPEPLPKGTVVLHIGDSMADALGKPLNRELDKRGIKSYLEAREATYIPEWAGFKMELDRHLAYRKPDLVLVTLGGNEMMIPKPSERVAAIQRIVEKIGDRPCLWIAAPIWRGLKSTGLLDVIRENCAPCVYVDTNVLIPDLERLKDGVHPTIPERRRWARFMIRWLLHNRDPKGAKPWSFKKDTDRPPPESETWLLSL
jgi:acyl-CoA thioesterase-1